MRRWPGSIFSLLLLMIIMAHCSTPPKEAATDNSKVLLSKIDSEYVKLADLRIAELKDAEKVFGADNNYSDVIKQYEAAGADVSRKSAVFWQKFANDDDPKWQRAMAQAEAQMDRILARAEKNGGIVPVFNLVASDRNFDLALKENDFAIQQVKMLNSHFGDASKETLDAIAYYDKLSKDEKVKMLSGNANLTPVPDYQRFIYQRLDRNYFLQKLLLQQQLNKFLQYRCNRYINEFPQGYKTTSYRQVDQTGDKQFDLRKIAMNTKR